MEDSWWEPVKQYIEEHYVQSSRDWFDVSRSSSGSLDITIVSERFAGLLMQARREQIWDMLRHLQLPTATGFLSLYTPTEADSIQLGRPHIIEEPTASSWLELAQQAANAAKSVRKAYREPRIPRTIAFYSFKGGVGRTTALAHVAWILAMRGRKVVVVDLDVEAPGLSSALPMEDLPSHGIVDYFYERAYLPEDIAPEIAITEIFSEVRIPDAPGRLFVVPAGELTLDYIAKVDDLRAATVTANGEDLWASFYREITDQLQPDIILIDSRTGINEWGAFSLLKAADKAVVFLYPNEQNRNGIDLLLGALSGTIPVQLVFSPVPFGDAGIQRVKEYWQAFQQKGALETDNSDGDEEEPFEGEEAQVEIAEPITVQYLTEIALAAQYPVQSLLSQYATIANVVDEDTTSINLSSILTDTAYRKRIIESLKFPEVDAANPRQNLRDLFQRTADFDRFLDDTTCLIRGRKGTGKTALYWLLLKHEKAAQELSRGRLERVTCLSGHGRFRGRPTRDEFQAINQAIVHGSGSWEAIWRAYLFVRMYKENIAILQRLRRIGKNNKFSPLLSILSTLQKGDNWQSEDTHMLIQMATDAALNLLAKDALNTINEQLHKNRQTFWFLYDDLDEDFLEKGKVREQALIGLFQLVQASDARRLTAIHFKIFLREDIWSRLIFDNKSHLNGRDIILKWTRADFLRLALRQAFQSAEFKDIVDRFSPAESIDQADEETIERALQLLWGGRREQNLKSKYVSRWVYDRLTDSSETTFPRSLNNLLTTAKEYELKTYKGQQLPADRLLRSKSLNEGLLEASAKRCDDMREEYPELRPFFDALVNVEIIVSESKLQAIWQETVREILSTFKDFVDFLLSIGLIGLAQLQEKEQGYRFAEIYTYGFNMYRGRRKH